MPGEGSTATAAAGEAGGGGGRTRKVEVFGIPVEHYAYILAGAFVANQLFKFATGMWDIVAEVRNEQQQQQLETGGGEADAAGHEGATASSSASSILYNEFGRLSLLVSVFATSIVSVVFYKLLCKKPAANDDEESSTTVVEQVLSFKKAKDSGAAGTRRNLTGKRAANARTTDTASFAAKRKTGMAASSSGGPSGRRVQAPAKPLPSSRAPITGMARKSSYHARSKDKIAAAMQSMFPAVHGSEDVVRQWEESVALAAENKSSGTGGASGSSATAAAPTGPPDHQEQAAVTAAAAAAAAAADLERRMNAITARKQVRNFLLNYNLGEYADAVLEFGADTPQRLRALTTDDLTAIGVKQLHKRELLGLLDREKKKASAAAD